MQDQKQLSEGSQKNVFKANLPKLELYIYYVIFALSVLFILYSSIHYGDFCFFISLLSTTIFDTSFYLIVHHFITETARLISIKKV